VLKKELLLPVGNPGIEDILDSFFIEFTGRQLQIYITYYGSGTVAHTASK